MKTFLVWAWLWLGTPIAFFVGGPFLALVSIVSWFTYIAKAKVF